jgi:hypothetical protein
MCSKKTITDDPDDEVLEDDWEIVDKIQTIKESFREGKKNLNYEETK